jgi:hypothetical protein
LLGGLALLLAGIVLYGRPALAAIGGGGEEPWHYTQHPARAATGRMLTLYVDRDFSEGERQQIVSAIRQWNIALNGLLQFRATLLPNESPATLQQIRRSGGWIVARVDSGHPIVHTAVGAHALAVTAGGRGGGFVYVIGDRIGGRDLTSVVMHELGHVLGAGHGQGGLMAPVYTARTGHCIDHDAAALVASAQHLPLQQMNWCVGPGVDPRPTYSMRH